MGTDVYPWARRLRGALRAAAVMGLGLGLGCGAGNLGGSDPGTQCEIGTQTCIDNAVNVCGENHTYTATQSCGSMLCDSALGCVQCAAGTPTCVGNEVHECTASGAIGAMTESCAFGQTCSAGSCIDSCELAASDFVYLVDDKNQFLSFAPKNDIGAGSAEDSLFSTIGTMACTTTRSPYPGLGGVTPFSMAVDRHATAWVLYTTGEMFNVSPKDASCKPTTYEPTQLGWETFGMGYVSDAPGAKTDTLYVARATVTDNTDMSLGKIDGSLKLSRVGGFTGVTHSPEMSGTGNAELYGYFPSNQAGSHKIALIDRASGAFLKTYTLDPLPSADQKYAFAFAHWGGRFYAFISMKLTSGANVNRVYRYDPATNKNTLILDNSTRRIVGAGVSTCAPVQIG